MKFENTSVMNMENAIRGMRNPKNSWHLSDSHYEYRYKNNFINIPNYNNPEIIDQAQEYEKIYVLGPNDKELAQRLLKAGSPHDKFMRQILVSVDITGSMYWNAEMDTYKVATVRNSCSKMHKIQSSKITLDCFELDGFEEAKSIRIPDPESVDKTISLESYINTYIISFCEWLREKYNETKDKRYWKELIRWLPEGWLQKYTWTGNYATLRGIVKSRANHKLNEWSGKENKDLPNMIDWIRSLPYSEELIFYDIDLSAAC